ncbi:MAG: cobalamin-binding protein [Sphingobacteriaceae bacterium]|nr:MAG: cobalamin-binding protein [Sphingobacteriaceae bacterium]
MPVFYDQLNRPVNISSTPKRIISVVPSQTELLFDLGLDTEITGITKFCIHPAQKVKTITKVGGTKQLNIELIKILQPDLIIANKEENEQQQIEKLAELFPVWVSDINDLGSAIDMIGRLGVITHREIASKELISQITEQFDALPSQSLLLKAVYLIWRNPYMAAGQQTYIDAMLRYCGLTNAIFMGRYPELNIDELKAAAPQVVLLSSEPYLFRDKHIAEIKDILPDAKVLLVDGEMFSWYGSRLMHVPAYFTRLHGMLV